MILDTNALSAFIDGDAKVISAILNIDSATTRHYAAIRLDLKRAGNPIPANDVWVAALSRQHSMPVMSRDKHFDHVTGLKRNGW